VRFLVQFNNVLILVLIGASLITALLGHWIDTGVILLVVLANAVIGFVQEGKAEQALDAIRKMISPQASVLREGHRLTVAAEDLVPGDIVILDAGDRVPADTRLARIRNLRIDEALLTGESVPVDKNAEAVAADAPVGDRSSMAFSGTLVVSGHGTGIVVGTGTNTELGRISEMLGSIETLTTPLIRKMNQFARQLAVAILLLSALLFVFAAFIRSRLSDRGRLHGGCRVGRGCDPRGPAGRHDDHARDRRSAHGLPQCHHPAIACRRNAGLRFDHLRRQDRHLHAQRNDRA
jgi:magnesium-transporting ATPase (P-type)